MLIDQRSYVEQLKDHLGADRLKRLSDLMLHGGLTPTEARPWLEPPRLPWGEIEAAVFSALMDRHPYCVPLPWHVERWIERYREAHTSSLFDD